MRISMNKERAKKMGAIYYKEVKNKFTPGDMAINPATGEVVKFPSDAKQFATYCNKLWDGYFVKVKPDAAIKKAYAIEKHLRDLESETRKYEDMQNTSRGKMMTRAMKGQKDIICLFIHRNHKEMVSLDEVLKAVKAKGDKLLSFGRRYDGHSGSLWVALIETSGFVDSRYYNISRSSFNKLSSVGYRQGDKFNDSVGLVLFNHGKKLAEPLDLDAIRDKERKKKEAAAKRAEIKMWKNIKTYDDKKEKPNKTKIFAYKGILGMVTHPGLPGIIAKPEKGNLGVVIEAKHCDITPEAKQMFQYARREGGSFAAIQLTGGDNPCIGWLGGYQMACTQKDIEIGRDCDKSTLDKMNLVQVPDMVFPKSFIDYVDKQK